MNESIWTVPFPFDRCAPHKSWQTCDQRSFHCSSMEVSLDHLVLQSFSTLFSRCPDANSSQRDCESGPWDEVCNETKLGGTHVLKQEYVDAMWNSFSAIVLFATVSLKSGVSMRAAAILAQSHCGSNTTFVAEGRRVVSVCLCCVCCFFCHQVAFSAISLVPFVGCSCGKEGFADSTSSGPIDEKLPSVAKEDKEEEKEPQRIARANFDLLIARGERRCTDVGLNNGRGGGGVSSL